MIYTLNVQQREIKENQIETIHLYLIRGPHAWPLAITTCRMLAHIGGDNNDPYTIAILEIAASIP